MIDQLTDKLVVWLVGWLSGGQVDKLVDLLLVVWMAWKTKRQKYTLHCIWCGRGRAAATPVRSPTGSIFWTVQQPNKSTHLGHSESRHNFVKAQDRVFLRAQIPESLQELLGGWYKAAIAHYGFQDDASNLTLVGFKHLGREKRVHVAAIRLCLFCVQVFWRRYFCILQLV